jgi:hypothetical protein
MPLQIQEEMVREGVAGVSTMTFELIPYEKSLSPHSQIFAETMRRSNKDTLTFRSDSFPREVEVRFQDILDANAGCDPESCVLRISTKFLPSSVHRVNDGKA